MHFPILRSIVVLFWISCIAGAVVIAGLTLEYYSWTLFAAAGAIGVIGGIPLGLWTAQRMRATRPITRPASPTMDPEASAREADITRRVPYPPATSQGEA